VLLLVLIEFLGPANPLLCRTVFLKDLINSLTVDANRVELVQTILLFFTFAVEDTTKFAPYLRDALPATLALQISTNEVLSPFPQQLRAHLLKLTFDWFRR
jgi:hypothetical protein